MRLQSRYAHLERERRFLLPSSPTAGGRVVPGPRVLAIEDRYLHGTRLRLRTVREPGRAPVRKLGQKVRPDQDQHATVEHTTLYLDEAEAAALLVVPADVLAKTRTLQPWQAFTLAVDVFAGRLTGLVLAEVELGEAGVLSAAGPPLAWLAEVTDDERFTGGHLARTCAADLTAVLYEFGLRRSGLEHVVPQDERQADLWYSSWSSS